MMNRFSPRRIPIVTDRHREYHGTANLKYSASHLQIDKFIQLHWTRPDGNVQTTYKEDTQNVYKHGIK